MGKGKEKKEMGDIDFLENIRNLPEGMQEELSEFAANLFKKANIKIRLQEAADNSGTKNDVFPKRVIVDLDVKCAEDEFEEYEDCLRYLDEAGAGILNYWPRYRFHVRTRHGRVFYDVLQQGAVFIDTNGQFQVDFTEDIKKQLANIFKDEKGYKPKISFMVEIIDIEQLKSFNAELKQISEGEKTKKVSTEKYSNKILHMPKVSKWEDISLYLEDNHTVTIKIKGEKNYRCSYEQLGFADKTKKGSPPNKLWNILINLFPLNGVIPMPKIPSHIGVSSGDNLPRLARIKKQQESVRTNKHRLSNDLKIIFDLKEDPFEKIEEGYKFKIKLINS